MNRRVSARRVILTSFFVDLLDIAVNLIVTFLTGSAVMASELVQGITDLVASGLLLIGLRRSKKEAYFWVLSSSLVMLLVASTFSFYFGLERFLNPHEVKNIYIAYTALVVGTISNGYAFLLSAQRILRKYKSFKNSIREFRSSSLIMTKNTFVLDLMGMSAAFLGLVALILYQVFKDFRFDGLGAMWVGVVLGLFSLSLVWDVINLKRKEHLADGL